MIQERLIAEIADDQIRYILYQQNTDSEYKILNKKISTNTGIRKGKILDFNYTAKKINEDVKNIEKESNKIFKDISIIINEPEILCTNLTGIKKINGSKVEKRDLDYILNEAKSSVVKNQKKNSILHILNSNFILDKTKQTKIPLNLHGDQLGLHMTFISFPTNSLKNITALFSNSDMKIDRFVSKPFACGIDLLNKNSDLKNFVIINFDKEMSSVSLYEDCSLVFLRTFPFGTNSIYRDIAQLCSLNENEVITIIDQLNLDDVTGEKISFLEKKFFIESKFKRLSINHLKDIIDARINEMTNHIFNKNKNLYYLNEEILNIYLFFEDVSIFKSLCNLFEKSLKTSSQGIQTESLPLNDFAALSGAAELIFKGWHKEAIPLSHRKKSIISSFFERFF